MRSLRLALFSLAACLSFVVHAACVYYTIDGTGGQQFPTAGAACSAYISAAYGGAAGVWGVTTPDETGCQVWAQPSSGPAVHVNTKPIHKVTDPECDQCAPKAGKTSMLNFTAGWARSGVPNAVDHVGQLSFPSPGAPFCEDGCIIELGDVDDCFRSEVPAPTGLHRISCDYPAVGKGAQCTPSAADAAHDKTQPPLPCPGFVGEVNGETKCVGTASKPIPPPSGPGVGQATGDAEDKGNPTAGTKPSSGEGSGTGGAGRTPSTGSGTAAGGPAGAAGTKPDGTTPRPDDGKEQAACGAPGQPKCGIDEGGTPGRFDGDKAALDGWKSAVDANRGTIKDADGSFFDSYNMFFTAPPVVACEPLELPNEQVITRHCEVVDGTRSVMSYIWALAAIWLCLGWIREAI